MREGGRGGRLKGIHGCTACMMHAWLPGRGSLAWHSGLAGLSDLQTGGLLQDGHDQVGRKLLLQALHDGLSDLHHIGAWPLCLLQQLLEGCQQLRCDGRCLIAVTVGRSL